MWRGSPTFRGEGYIRKNSFINPPISECKNPYSAGVNPAPSTLFIRKIIMARRTKAQIERDQKISRIISLETDGVQIDIMDLSKVSKEAERAYDADEDVSAAVKAIIQKLRKN